MKSLFGVTGMTCGSCEAAIEGRLARIPGVRKVSADRESGRVEIEADRRLPIAEVRGSLSDLPKYAVTDAAPAKKPWHEIYRPLWVLFLFAALVSFAVQAALPVFDAETWMRHFMAGFFLGVSYFKFLDLRAFATGFAGYDPVARRWAGYGFVYPFIELAIGVSLAAGAGTSVANVAAIVVLSLTTIGVVERLRNPTAIQCACLGSAFNLPLSRVTVVENAVMIGMAVMGLSRSGF